MSENIVTTAIVHPCSMVPIILIAAAVQSMSTRIQPIAAGATMLAEPIKNAAMANAFLHLLVRARR